MKTSHYFLPILKDPPSEASTISHRWMLQSGMVQSTVSGIYTWLPLGLRVLQKIQTIIRQEQNAIGAIEMLAPTLQPAALWQESGRYDDYGLEMLRVKDRHERELVYGPTAEEVFVDVVRRCVQSYKALPLNLYNIQWKFRDEIRPRFGVMRGREFLMKDGYSFDLTEKASKETYCNVFRSYMKAFYRMGLSVIPLRATTGPIGGDFSHEFHVIAQTGESTLYYDAELENREVSRFEVSDFEKLYAMVDEKHLPEECSLPLEQLKISKGIEVGHIFHFGDKYSAPMKAHIFSKEGILVDLQMGSYGIGVSRLVGAVIEAFHDASGPQWPLSIAPFSFGLIHLQETVESEAMHLYTKLKDLGIETLWEDRPFSPGEKFALMDMIGLPFQAIVSEKNHKNNQIEVKIRKTGERFCFSLDQFFDWAMLKCAEQVSLPDMVKKSNM
ncbi:proline--tRNA ligase [Holospora obtusa F1]|uniref:Proline--tRNA ligase n=1 Tax=Holospora obtusa F1 TaxID=1399147 RepID=W6TDY8_HOLOB|nr:proline--tRNA ligase [Holospora obtusa]ETZ07066.1 proline--tRNA ligase [Holospora obtusa F1]